MDEAAGSLMADDRMKPDGPMPFDGHRMIYAGSGAAFTTGEGGKFGYADGLVASVPGTSARAVSAMRSRPLGFSRKEERWREPAGSAP